MPEDADLRVTGYLADLQEVTESPLKGRVALLKVKRQLLNIISCNERRIGGKAV